MSLDDWLAVLIYVLVIPAWASAAILAWAARRPPRIGALTERSIIAVIIALFLTSIAVLVFDSEADALLFPQEISRVIFRLCVLFLGLVPMAWVVLWATGRLGQDGEA